MKSCYITLEAPHPSPPPQGWEGVSGISVPQQCDYHVALLVSDNDKITNPERSESKELNDFKITAPYSPSTLVVLNLRDECSLI